MSSSIVWQRSFESDGSVNEHTPEIPCQQKSNNTVAMQYYFL